MHSPSTRWSCGSMELLSAVCGSGTSVDSFWSLSLFCSNSVNTWLVDGCLTGLMLYLHSNLTHAIDYYRSAFFFVTWFYSWFLWAGLTLTVFLFSSCEFKSKSATDLALIDMTMTFHWFVLVVCYPSKQGLIRVVDKSLSCDMKLKTFTGKDFVESIHKYIDRRLAMLIFY